jgi:hypothetical protein
MKTRKERSIPTGAISHMLPHLSVLSSTDDPNLFMSLGLSKTSTRIIES